MNWLTTNNVWVQGLIVGAIMMAIVLLVGSFVLFAKPTINRKSIKYLYSFSSGFILITATVGQFGAAKEYIFEEHPLLKNETLNIVAGMGLIVLGFMIGITIAYLILKYSHSHFGADHDKTHTHDHEIDNTYEHIVHNHHPSGTKGSRFPGILMLTAHRLPAGIALGSMTQSLSSGNLASGVAVANIIALIIHIIPELLIIYYGQVDAGTDKKKAFIFGVFAKTLIVPGIFIGVALGELSDVANMNWLLPLIFATIGALMTWAVVIEFMPEFIHHRMEKGIISKMSLVFMLGTAISVCIQFIHIH